MREVRVWGRLAAVAAVVLSGVAVTGCSAVPGGPAIWGSDGRAQDTLCSPVRTGASVLVADVLEAPDDTALEILAVEAVEPRGVSISEIAVAPLDRDSGSIGNSPVPPTDAFTATIWKDRVTAAGYKLAAGDRADVLLVAERTTGETGSIENIRLCYRSGGIVYEKEASTRYLFAQTCAE